MTTLNLRCGSDIREKLSEAGIVGDFLEYADPLCQGPAPAGLDVAAFRECRAVFIATDYGYSMAAARERLADEDVGLEGSLGYERIVLWLEHDIYDQAILIRLLDWFAGRPESRSKLFLLCIDRFPGVARFTGLGQLSPTQLAELAGREKPVTEAQYALATRAWSAFTSPSPDTLAHLLDEDTSPLPFLAPALRRHLQELPWTGTGLGLTERLTLEAVANGAQTPADAFRALHELEPQPFLGDLMFWPVVKRLGEGADPALTQFASPRETIEITATGRSLLAGDADWVALNGIDRWVGGVHLAGLAAAWRWDDAQGTVVAT